MITAQPRSEPDAFQELLDQQYQSIATQDALQRLRAKAWERFQELGLPAKTDEVWRYLRLRTLYTQAYSPADYKEVNPALLSDYIYPECANSTLVFVNGFFRPELSRMAALPKKMAVIPLHEAVRTYSAFLSNQWTKSLKEENDAFSALNAALHEEGAFIYLPPKTICEAPVQILHVIDAKEIPMMILPRVQLFVGTHSEITLVSSQAVLSGKGYCINQATDVQLEENAHVRYAQITMDLTDDIWQLDAFRASLKRNSTLKTIQVTDGSLSVRSDLRVALTGENAEALLNGVWMLADKREAHTHVLIEHQAPHCHSNQLFKGVLNDFSRSSFEGKILVRQAAQKTEAYQLNNNLLLSERANADSKPNLEIFADDVKASHGATVGQLDIEQLFYLKTRGFLEEEAKNILVYGFCKEVIDMIQIPSLREEISRKAQRYLAKE